MSYIFTSSNGFLKIVNAATGYEASTPNPLDISINTNQVTGAPGIKLINADISLLMDLTEIATIGASVIV